jgi:uncharacterized membrane protein
MTWQGRSWKPSTISRDLIEEHLLRYLICIQQRSHPMKALRNIKLVLLFSLSLALTACGGGGGGSEPTVAGTNFTVIPLEALLTGAFSAGVDINNSGFAVGLADNGTAVQGVRWNATATPPTATVLEPLAGNSYSAAYALNDSGISVGESQSGVTTLAVFWPAALTSASTLSTVGLFADGASAAYGINSGGEIAGEAVNDAEGNTVAVYWLDNTADPLILGNLGTQPNAFSAAYDIGDNGIIVGESLKDNGDTVAVAWQPDGAGGYEPPVELPALANHISSVALGANEAGAVVGESEAIDGTVHGVIWTVDTLGAVSAPQDMGADTSAAGISNGNRIAGYTAAGSGTDSANIWNGGALDDQRSLAPAFSQSYAVNNSSQSVGIAGNQAFVALPQ